MIKIIGNILFFTSIFISNMAMANSSGMITFHGAIVEGGCEVTQSGNKIMGNCSGTDNPEKFVNYKNINKMNIKKPYPLPENKGYMYVDSIDKTNKIAFLHVVYK